MNKRALRTLCLLLIIGTHFLSYSQIISPAPLNSQSHEWTWIHGENIGNPLGHYGIQGVYKPDNQPSGRDGALTWTREGEFWLMGGVGYQHDVWGHLNDLWKYSPALNQWMWVAGDTTEEKVTVYGIKAVMAPTNQPGGRTSSATWLDREGNLWLFGGTQGYGTMPSMGGYLSDLWKYDVAAGMWVWVHGDNSLDKAGNYGTQGVPSPTNKPGGRQYAMSWVDENGDFWLFGGDGFSATGPGTLSDLWKYSPSTNEWTWVNGTSTTNALGVYGTPGIPGGRPGARSNAMTWKDNDGNIWVFGGWGYPSQNQLSHMNDLWKYNLRTNEWTWIRGDIYDVPRYNNGVQGVPSPTNDPRGRSFAMGWKDASGDLWLYGGLGYQGTAGTPYGGFSELWRYNIASNQWTWVAGSSELNVRPNYGTKWVTAPSNTPGWRQFPASWTDNNFNFYLFGGGTHFSNGRDRGNDLWGYGNIGCTFPLSLPDTLKSCTEESMLLDAGTGYSTYLWNTGASSQRIQASTDGDYTVTVTNTSGCKATSSIYVSLPNADIAQEDKVLCESAPVTLSLRPTAGRTILWSTGAVTESITVEPAESTTYYATVSNSVSSCTDSVKIALATVDATLTTSGPTTLCTEGSVTLQVPEGSSYQWQRDGEDITGATEPSYVAAQSGSYQVLVNNAAGCAAPSETVVVSINLLAGASLANRDTTVCKGATATLSSMNAARASLLWSTGTTTPSISVTPLETSTYWLQMTQDGCSKKESVTIRVATLDTSILAVGPTAFCAGASVTLQAGAASSYQWLKDGMALQDATASTFSATETGNYRVQVSNDNGCTDLSRVLTVTNNLAPAASITASKTSICEGSSAELQAGGGDHYQWHFNSIPISGATGPNFSATRTGSYSVSVTNSAGCRATSNDVSVTVNPLPTGNITAPRKEICEGNMVELRASGGERYQWLLNNNPIPGATTSTLNATGAGNYNVEIISRAGCKGQASNIWPLTPIITPTASFQFNSYCAEKPVQFVNTSNNYSAVNWHWKFGDGSLSTNQVPTHIFAKSGTYTVTLIVTPDGCPNLLDSISKTIDVKAAVPGIRYATINASKGQLQPLEARNIGQNYSWLPRTDLIDDDRQTALLTPTSSREYLVEIRQVSGCITMDTVQVNVFEKAGVFVPTGFTPNRDGINDVLRPILVNILDLKFFRVYNRWGQQVYETRKMGEGWDGTFRGKLQPKDTYVWILEAVDAEQKVIQSKGQFVIIH